MKIKKDVSMTIQEIEARLRTLYLLNLKEQAAVVQMDFWKFNVFTRT